MAAEKGIFFIAKGGLNHDPPQGLFLRRPSLRLASAVARVSNEKVGILSVNGNFFC